MKLSIFPTLIACSIMLLGNSAPQAPLAQGPFESIVKTVRAARACGIHELRIQVREETTFLFYDGMPEPGTGNELQCLARWQKKNAQRLSLSTKWFKYDYAPN